MKGQRNQVRQAKLRRYRAQAVGWLSVLLLMCSLVACRRAVPLPTLGKIGTFQLQDQAAQPFSPEKLRGRVWVAAFMFTRCPIICPRITRQMQQLQVIAKAKKLEVSFVSISVDPENDTPSVLRQYGAKYGADFATWSFLTGDYALIKQTAEQGFKLALEGRADAKQADFGITHGSHLVLLDVEGQIRGYYRSSEDEAMKQLMVDAGRLIAEAE